MKDEVERYHLQCSSPYFFNTSAWGKKKNGKGSCEDFCKEVCGEENKGIGREKVQLEGVPLIEKGYKNFQSPQEIYSL